MKPSDGGPAFPCIVKRDNGRGYGDKIDVPLSGMSLRDYFAAKAPPEEVNTILVFAEKHREVGLEAYLANISWARGKWADAMLTESERNHDH